MKSLGCLLLLLHCAAVTVSQSCTQQGGLEIIGVERDGLRAGHLEICVLGVRRVVYHDNWGLPEAKKVCRELGFPPEGTIACRDSCLGASKKKFGFTVSANCQEERLIDCGSIPTDGVFPDVNAGIICTTPPSNTCVTATPTISIETEEPENPEERGEDIARVGNCGETDTTTALPVTGRPTSAIAAVLGVASFILLISLVGVVLGWVWSCHRKKQVQSEPQPQVNNKPTTFEADRSTSEYSHSYLNSSINASMKCSSAKNREK